MNLEESETTEATVVVEEELICRKVSMTKCSSDRE